MSDSTEPMHIDDDGWREWPGCGGCGKRRQTVCEFCGAAGFDFPLADVVAEAPELGGAPRAPDLPLLMCEVCDEPFQPRFYRLCFACGHDNGDGIEMEKEDSEGELPSRVLIVVGALLALALIALLYFALVLRS